MPVPIEAIARPRRPRRLARPLLWFIFGGSSVASLIALAGQWHWFADLFTHFRLYYLLAQGLLVIAFLNTRRYLWLALTLAVAAPNLWYVGPYLAPLVGGTQVDAAARSGPQLVTLNLSYTNPDPTPALAYLQRVQPDIVVLSEYTPAWHAVISDQLADWPHRVLRPRETPFGMAIYSREPFSSAEQLDLGVPGTENLRVRLRERGLELFAVHLVPPRSPRLAAARNRQLAALARQLGASARPRLVTGDLNLTPFSPHFRRLLQVSEIRDARRAQGLHVTWPTLPVPLWIPIDHTLADAAAGVIDVRTGPNIGSDHFPLEVTLAPAG